MSCHNSKQSSFPQEDTPPISEGAPNTQGVQRLLGEVISAIQADWGIDVSEEVRRVWITARGKVREELQLSVSDQIPDAAFLRVLPDTHALGSVIKEKIVQNLKQ